MPDRLEGRPVEEKTSSRDFPDDEETTKAAPILKEALSSVKEAAENALGEAKDVRAISLPYQPSTGDFNRG